MVSDFLLPVITKVFIKKHHNSNRLFMRGPNPRWYGVPLMYLISNLFLPNTSVYMRLKPDRIQIVMMSFPSYMGSCRLQIVQEEFY